MESSDDDTLSERSCVSEPSFRSERSGGSLSPCTSGLVGPPGDTLPWNLSKHERKKRKSQDSVLDPAERAVVRVAGELINVILYLSAFEQHSREASRRWWRGRIFLIELYKSRVGLSGTTLPAFMKEGNYTERSSEASWVIAITGSFVRHCLPTSCELLRLHGSRCDPCNCAMCLWSGCLVLPV